MGDSADTDKTHLLNQKWRKNKRLTIARQFPITLPRVGQTFTEAASHYSRMGT